jgi:hypothetical protein
MHSLQKSEIGKGRALLVSLGYLEDRNDTAKCQGVWSGIGLLQLATTSNTDLHGLQFTTERTNILYLLCLTQSSGTGFQRWAFPFLWLHNPVPWLNHYNSRLTPTELSTLSSRLTVDWISPRHSRLPVDTSSLQLLSTDSKGNTTPECCVTRTKLKAPFDLLIVASRSVTSNGCTWHNTFPVLHSTTAQESVLLAVSDPYMFRTWQQISWFHWWLMFKRVYRLNRVETCIGHGYN